MPNVADKASLNGVLMYSLFNSLNHLIMKRIYADIDCIKPQADETLERRYFQEQVFSRNKINTLISMFSDAVGIFMGLVFIHFGHNCLSRTDPVLRSPL